MCLLAALRVFYRLCVCLLQALIQTYLNSPENGTITQHDLDNDRRMNPQGFEETELCYAVGDDDDDPESAAVRDVIIPLLSPVRPTGVYLFPSLLSNNPIKPLRQIKTGPASQQGQQIIQSFQGLWG